jgi:hypothetical protein
MFLEEFDSHSLIYKTHGGGNLQIGSATLPDLTAVCFHLDNLLAVSYLMLSEDFVRMNRCIISKLTLKYSAAVNISRISTASVHIKSACNPECPKPDLEPRLTTSQALDLSVVFYVDRLGVQVDHVNWAQHLLLVIQPPLGAHPQQPLGVCNSGFVHLGSDSVSCGVGLQVQVFP